MKYKINLKLGYNRASFLTDNAKEATDFMEFVATHYVNPKEDDDEYELEMNMEIVTDKDEAPAESEKEPDREEEDELEFK